MKTTKELEDMLLDAAIELLGFAMERGSSIPDLTQEVAEMLGWGGWPNGTAPRDDDEQLWQWLKAEQSRRSET